MAHQTPFSVDTENRKNGDGEQSGFIDSLSVFISKRGWLR